MTRRIVLVVLALANGYLFVLHAVYLDCVVDLVLDALGIVACGLLWDKKP